MRSKCTPINLFKNNNFNTNLIFFDEESNLYKIIPTNKSLSKLSPRLNSVIKPIKSVDSQ